MFLGVKKKNNGLRERERAINQRRNKLLSDKSKGEERKSIC